MKFFVKISKLALCSCLFLHLIAKERTMSELMPIETGAISREGKEAAFNAMLLRNKAMLWHICSDYSLGRAWRIEDCMQEVICYLWRDFSKFEGRSSEKTWVYRVATNTMLMLRRKDTKSLAAEPFNPQEINNITSETNNENYMQLLQLIDLLPEKDGVAIRAHLDGFSYQEIAMMTHSTLGAVAMRIARVKKRLKRMYEKDKR